MSEETDRANPASVPADGIAALWRRLKDHRIAQWSIGYIAVAYGIQHAVTLTSEAFDWPHEITRISMLMLVLGLPLAMAIAWYHGEKASRRITAGELSIVAVLLVIASLLFYVFVKPEPAPTASAAVAAKVASASVPTKPASASIPAPSGPSVAVLPFLNLSGDPKEEYFSDGMTEEITSALTNVKGLNVVARTSAFAFKGKNEDITAIGQALHASDIIEGSVRKEGNQVRITAQLIRTDTGDHLWTDSYDRNLTDIFAVQEDVAKAIAGALQVPLGLNQGETLVSNRTADTQSYDDYLRALALYRARDIKSVITLLEPMVKRDPNYAPAWALLAQAYNLVPIYLEAQWNSVDEIRRSTNLALAKAEAASRNAMQLDPKYAFSYAALGFTNFQRMKWSDAESNFQKALALDPADPDTLHLYGVYLLAEGRLNSALKVRTTLRRLEPFVPVYNLFTALAMQFNGDAKGAIAIMEPLRTDGTLGAQRNGFLAQAYADQARFAASADTMLKTSPDQNWISMSAVEQAAAVIRKAPAQIGAIGATPASESNYGFVYAFVGAPERFLDSYERMAAIGNMVAGAVYLTWDPSLSAARKTERFKTLVRKLGLVDYWRAKGWPDLCHPVGADDFACN